VRRNIRASCRRAFLASAVNNNTRRRVIDLRAQEGK